MVRSAAPPAVVSAKPATGALPMDFTDAVVVALCERLSTNPVASVDRDFRISRSKGRTGFVNAFDDGAQGRKA